MKSQNGLHTQTPPKASNAKVVQQDTASANVDPNANGVRLRGGLRPSSLPSTIPDSARPRTMSKHSQSQGDTQPVSQWVYDKYTNGGDTQPKSNDRQDTTQNEATGSQGHVGQTVHSPHVNLLAAWEQHSARDVESLLPFAGLNEEDDDLPSQGVYMDFYPESKRFSVPKTPASQSRKRKRGSQMPSQETETPSLPVNPFAGQLADGNLMDPSQLFKATQALTSPANAAMDNLSDRPSPDLQNMQRPSTADTVSSPITLRRANMTRSVTEPHTTYLSMKESQEERERQRKLQEQRDLEDESSDGEFNTDDTAIKKYICKNRRDHAARTQFAGLTASPVKAHKRPYTKRHGKGAKSPQSSPLRSGKHLSDPLIISDDVPAELAIDDTTNITEDETEHEEDVEERAVVGQPADLAEENKENVEVPMSEARPVQATSDLLATQPTPTHNNVRTISRVTRASQSKVEPSSPIAPRSPERSTASTNPSQTYGVADSQSSQCLRTERPAIGGFHSSSLDSRAMVPQSQLSQVVKSSSAPIPPTQDEASPRQSEDKGEVTIDKVPQDASKAAVSDKPNDEQSEVTAERKDATTHQSPRAQVEAYRQQSTEQTKLDSVASHVPSHFPTPDSTSKAPSSHKTVTPSGPSTMYETALETMDQTPSKSRVSTLRSGLRSKPTSPAKSQSQSQSWRGMSDIMADSSPQDNLGDDIADINILTEDDKAYHHTLNGLVHESRPEKRRKLGHQRGLRRETSFFNRETSTRATSPTRWRRLEKDLEAEPEVPLTSSQPTWSMTTQPEAEPEAVVDDTSLPTNQISSDQMTVSDLLKANAGLKALPATVAAKHRTSSESHSPVSSSPLKRKRDTSLSVSAAAASSTTTRNSPTPTPTARNRVFAHFNGDSSCFYPATCTGIIPGNEARYRVHFDHGADAVVSAYVIKRLELRPGDICKVDMEGMRTRNFAVLEARHPVETADGGHQAALTAGIPVSRDIYGHECVLLYPKNRQSDGGEQSDSSKLEMPISRVYITQTQWTAFKDRDFTFVPDKVPLLTGLQTPSERPSTPSTPTSRTRRAKAFVPSFSRPTKASADATGGLFTNLVFTLTNISSSTRLDQTKHLITSNGGRVLEQGFDELFAVPDISRPNSPSKRVPKNSTCQLTPEAKTVGFTCLIADEHWRGAKYMQALALGIPCLATRWVSDSLAKHTLLPLPPYLLAAGTSTFLDGATRSRTLDPMPDPNTSTLEEIVASRSTMLSDTSVLLIMQKHEEGPMRHHIFLTQALGASKVAKVTSVEAASKAISEAGEPWDWVYSHSDRVAEVEKVLYGGAVGGRGRKRKRTSGGARNHAEGGMKRPRVVEHEFVIQSLILGRLAE